MPKDMKNKPDENFIFDQDIYKDFVEKIEIFDTKLTAFEFKVKPEYFKYLNEEKKINGDIMSRSFNNEIENIHYEKDENIFIAWITWNLTIKRSNKKVLYAKAEYLTIYENAPEVADTYVKKFVHKVVPFATYPYFREKVAGFSWASGADLPVLPVLKIK